MTKTARGWKPTMEQVPTTGTSIGKIMSSAEFALGVADARAGRRYHAAYDQWDTNTQWNYERGRQWGNTAPKTVALKRGDEVTADAKRWYKDIL